jgi:glucosamine 6-phosphate synthetase-like amidotransferase/phosphosugar isomerase protein
MPSFAHEMLREIYEQPEALRRTTALYLDSEGLKPEVAQMLAAWSIPEGEVLIAATPAWLPRSCWKISAAWPWM